MLIGNTWVKGARLRILNAFVAVPASPVWINFPQTLVLNNEERAFTVGLSIVFTKAAGGLLEIQLLYDGTAAHEGFFHVCTDVADNMDTKLSNQQPTTMPMPFLDVPPDTEIGLRSRFMPGGGVNCYLDLFVVSYYMKDQEPAAGPVCYPPSGWALPCP